MLNKIYRAIVISRTKTAAIATLAHLSERDLNDMGTSRASFVEAQVESVIAELDAQDREAANTKIRKQLKHQQSVCLLLFNLHSDTLDR